MRHLRTQPPATSTLALAHSHHNMPLQQLLAEGSSSIPETFPGPKAEQHRGQSCPQIRFT